MLDQAVSKIDELTGHRLSLAAIKAQNAVAAVKARTDLAMRRVRTNTAFDEQGQGLTEYIIAIAGVLIIGGAVFALIRAVARKYTQAQGAVDSLPVSGGW